MKLAVVSFWGSNCDDDCVRVAALCGATATKIGPAAEDLGGAEAVILPGGFSHGDYLRCGAMAARTPVMAAVRRFAERGGPVLGICNGFQILTEAGLLPGALLRNAGLDFICHDQALRVDGRPTPWTRGLAPGTELILPVAHHDGRYFADEATLDRLEAAGQVVFRYVGDDPNGSARAIAGVCNAAGNVVGLMPHPERNAEPLLGNGDGRRVFDALLGAA